NFSKSAGHYAYQRPSAFTLHFFQRVEIVPKAQLAHADHGPLISEKMDALFRRKTGFQLRTHLCERGCIVIAAIVATPSRIGVDPRRTTGKFKGLLTLSQ